MSARRTGRLGRLTASLRTARVKPLVPFITAGYPDEPTFDRVLAAIAAAGCPLVEIGIPFSDPVADGPVIQAASQKVLARGMTLARTLALAATAHRDHGLDVVMMGYLNPILKFGPARFAATCGESSVAGVIVPDLPPEEAAGLRELLAARDVDLVDLVAPTTDPARLVRKVEQATGFLYLVSTTGVTGSGTAAADTLPDYLTRVRATTDLPLYVGFGIATPQQAGQVAALADGVIVGSALLRTLTGDRDGAVAAATEFLHEMAQAVTSAKGTSR